ncbi:activating transcription factor 7-interacting protein 1 isoform X2 [Pleurodeles waltl]|uniref:activating transcription factor 7-interacting protein 1 isoform X2 n=1 Tax=Pleurodeles waltl TaxID=8319 RepID=UPI003709ABA5
MSVTPILCQLPLCFHRFNMDITDEPQKKIFKARKTMKVSDRQQLEVVYKVKEDFKFLNGRHENGDSDASSLNDPDCMEDKESIGMLDICLEPNSKNVSPKEATVSGNMESAKCTQGSELLLTDEVLIETNPTTFAAAAAKQLFLNDTIDVNKVCGTTDQDLDLLESKEFIEEQDDKKNAGSVETTNTISDQPVEIEPVDTALSEERPVEELVEEDHMMLEVQTGRCMKEQLSVGEQQLNELPEHGVMGEVQQEQMLVESLQQELLEEVPEGVFSDEPQGDAELLAEPLQDSVAEEVGMPVAVDCQLEQAEIAEAWAEESGLQELTEQVKAKPIKMGELKEGLASDAQVMSQLLEPVEEEPTEDQLLEELAEEKQFEEELTEDNLLDELTEEQPPAKDIHKCEAASSVIGHEPLAEEEKVDAAEVIKEKFDILEKAESWSVVAEEESVMTEEKKDVEIKNAVIIESQAELVLQLPQVENEQGQTAVGKQELVEDAAVMECSSDVAEMAEDVEQSKILQEDNCVDAGEAAITSSIEMVSDSRIEKTDLPENTFLTPTEDLQNNCSMENSDSMETDDIIPILEKLAPVEDGFNSFSKPPVLFEAKPGPMLEDKVEVNQGSPSKQEHTENLPSEAFLVLSDEDDPCIEDVVASAVQLKQSSPAEKEEPVAVAKELDTKKDEQSKKGSTPEKSEAARRKRSKSEDIDSTQSKRRRYESEEYEAELQVKIATRSDIDQKLQKVIQRLLEEKLCALQCSVFDKALADLKSRVEKIECKKHESVLSGMQAKIARLSRRFGAAREDLKKRQEIQAVQPVPPGSPGKVIGDGSSTLLQRNVGTVRQMLDTRRTGDTSVSALHTPTTAAPPPLLAQPPPLQAAPSQALQRIAPTPSSQTLTVATPARSMPDWKLIQQRINATHLASPQSKSQTPVTSTQVMAPVLSSPTTATVVGTSQVQGSSGAPMSVSLQSLQSLPVILHVPVMQSTMQNATVMQSTTGTLVTNQQSGNMEFIPAQSQGNVGTMNKTPVSLTPAITSKPNNSPSLPTPTMQRNSPASGASSGPTLSVHAVSTAQPVAQAARTSLPALSTSGQYTAAVNRTQAQMKIPVSSFSSPTSVETPAPPRTDSQLNRTPTSDSIVAKRAAESTTQGGKPGGGVIDLTLDDEEANSSQDTRKQIPLITSGVNQPAQILPRPAQPQQTALVQQNSMAAGMSTQTTIHVLPTAQTTVNVNHRPMTQTMPRLSGPRTPTSHQVVYTTLPSAPIQTPVRSAVMQGPAQGLRQISPQTSGVAVRMPQTTAYVVNNGMTIGASGPQLTVHHRPPQVRCESVRTIHPAPLPEAPQPQRLPPEAANTNPPQKPHLKLARVQSQNGIVLSWSVLEVDRSCASVDSYHLYAYHEDPTASTPSQWKKIGEVKALPLPMACTLTQFVSGSKYYFAVRAKDVYGRFGVFCDPQSTDVIATQNS